MAHPGNRQPQRARRANVGRLAKAVSISLASAATFAIAEEDTIEPRLNQERWYGGLGTGIFDLDDNLVHLDSSAGSLWVGYRLHRFAVLELSADYIERDTDTAERGFTSEFAGHMIAPSVVLKYPIGEGWEPFARIGYTHLDYELLTETSGGLVEETSGQFSFGVGLDIGRFRVEYLNYGKIDDADIEQIRIGLNWSF